jgi:hypothetical protein
MAARGRPKGKDAVVDALNDLEHHGVIVFPQRRGGRRSNLLQVLPADLGPASGKPDGEQEGKRTDTVLRQAQNGSAAAATEAADLLAQAPLPHPVGGFGSTRTPGEVVTLDQLRAYQTRAGWLPEKEAA